MMNPDPTARECPARPRSFLLLLVLFCIAMTQAQAQKQGNNWYFGQFAGVTFNSGYPVAITDGVLSTDEGCATISDSLGGLLLYTDGVHVWNKNHKIMPNGSGLKGNSSSTESGVVCPHPGNHFLYYLFTVDYETHKGGFCYSLIDMRLDSGRGDIVVTEKNIQLFTPSTEKITSVTHNNKRDFWVVGHGWGNDSFYAYYIGPRGINKTPVISRSGSVHKGSVINSLGAMKCSSNGRRLALALYESGVAEIFYFDNAQGIVSDPITITKKGNYPQIYGIEFSLSGSMMYFSTESNSGAVYQADISQVSAKAINASVIKIDSLRHYGALQSGPDGKIYVAMVESSTLSCIRRPEVQGIGCSFLRNNVSLGGRLCEAGLPSFIQSFFSKSPIQVNNFCQGQKTSMVFLDSAAADSVKWMTADIIGNKPLILKGFSVRHIYSKAKNYTIEARVYKNTRVDTFRTLITITAFPDFNFGPDRFLCNKSEDILTIPGLSGKTLLWQNGANDTFFKVTGSGKYWLQATDKGCTSSDTINYVFNYYNPSFLGPDTFLCTGKTLNLAPQLTGKYTWQDGSNASKYSINKAGIYSVNIYSLCGNITDSINVSFVNYPVFTGRKDTAICEGTALGKYKQPAGSLFTWKNSAGDTFPELDKTGQYLADIQNACGNIQETVNLNIIFTPKNENKSDTLLCEGDSFLMDCSLPLSLYFWKNDSSTLPKKTISKAGFYEVQIRNQCGAASHTRQVELTDCNCYLYIPNSFTPNGDGLNDTFLPSACPTSEYKMQIYNRWGELIFESLDINKGWDGIFKNKKAPEGIYYYKIYLRDKEKKEKSATGVVNVVY